MQPSVYLLYLDSQSPWKQNQLNVHISVQREMETWLVDLERHRINNNSKTWRMSQSLIGGDIQEHCAHDDVVKWEHLPLTAEDHIQLVWFLPKLKKGASLSWCSQTSITPGISEWKQGRKFFLIALCNFSTTSIESIPLLIFLKYNCNNVSVIYCNKSWKVILSLPGIKWRKWYCKLELINLSHYMQINKTQLRNQVTLFLIFLARFAYLSVFRVSMKSRSDGETQAIMRVRLIEKEKSLTSLIIIYKSKMGQYCYLSICCHCNNIIIHDPTSAIRIKYSLWFCGRQICFMNQHLIQR